MSASSASCRPKGSAGSSTRRFALGGACPAKSWKVPTRRLHASDGDGWRLTSGGSLSPKVGPNDSLDVATQGGAWFSPSDSRPRATPQKVRPDSKYRWLQVAGVEAPVHEKDTRKHSRV